MRANHGSMESQYLGLLRHVLAHGVKKSNRTGTDTLGDAHLYLNHLEQARAQLARKPRELPILRLNPARTSLFDFEYENFELLGYDPHPAIPAPVAV